MTYNVEPLLHPQEIATLRPTQMTVGLREVARKRSEWRKRATADGGDFLGRHMVPVVLGPRQRYYIIDHHHLVRALHDEGVAHVLVSVVADLGALGKPAFWTVMAFRNWLYPVDTEGERRTYAQLPKTIGALADDPYRSLAGELRRLGGYAKDSTPYSEFLWADFLRLRIGRDVVNASFKKAVSQALDLARKPDASYLPGWCGPEAD